MVARFIFILFFSSQLFAATPQHKDFLIASQNERNELSASRELHTVLQGLRRNRLSASSTQSLLRLSKKSQGFKVYLPLIEKAHEIAKSQNDFQKFTQICEKPFVSLTEESFPTIGQRLQSDLQRFCRGLFLSHLNKRVKSRPSSRDQLSVDEQRYLDSALSFYVGSEHLDSFETFLKTIKPSSPLHQSLSSMITSSAIQLETIPPKEILSQISISDELTKHIQKNGLFDHAAANFFRTEFRKMGNHITTLIRTGEFAQASAKLDYAKVFFQQNDQYISQQLAWNTFGLSGRRLLYEKQFDLAKKSFKYAIDISDESQIDESYFYYIWTDIIQKDFKKALKSIYEINLLSNFKTHSSKLKYWIARVFEEVGNKKEALEFFEVITQTDPLSFYSILAIKELSKVQPAQTSHKVISKMRAPSAFTDFSDLKANDSFSSSLKRLSLWLDLGLDTYSYYEINEILDSTPEMLFTNAAGDINIQEFEKFMVSELSKMFNSKGKYLHTFRLVHNALNKDHFELNSEIISSLYPMEYFEDIKKIAPNVDPLVVLSLIRQESAFNESARSVAGARGLMQLMPATARQLQRNVRVHQLNQPSLNIRLGTRYLSRLLKNYDGDLIDTLSAYNAGQGNLRSWKESVFVFGEDDPMMKIEMIPFKETRKYVKLIYRNMFYYRLMTNDPMISETLAETLKVELN